MWIITACVVAWCVGLSHQADCLVTDCNESCDKPGFVQTADTCTTGVCCIPEVCGGMCIPERARDLFKGVQVDVNAICPDGEICIVIECGTKGGNANKRRRKKRVAGGSNAAKCEYPWQVRVEGLDSKCGGSIIDEYTVITAARCLPSPDRLDATNVKLYLGEYSLTDNTDHTFVTAVSYHLHPDYIPFTSQNNIGIIKLKDPIQFDDCIAPICLPSADQDFTVLECELSGWGSTTHGGPPSDILQKVTLPVVPYQDCRVTFSPVYITEQNICAGENKEGKNACVGDFGGPLACRSGSSYFLAGVSSWSDQCEKKPGTPGVYTDVSKYLEWINGLSGAP